MDGGTVAQDKVQMSLLLQDQGVSELGIRSRQPAHVQTLQEQADLTWDDSAQKTGIGHETRSQG